jgi:hypothetical protein
LISLQPAKILIKLLAELDQISPKKPKQPETPSKYSNACFLANKETKTIDFAKYPIFTGKIYQKLF